MRIRGAIGAVLLLLTAGATFATSGIAEDIFAPSNRSMEVTGSIFPTRLPVTQPAPVTLKVGFRSHPVEGSVRGIEKISFQINPGIDFATRWPQRCSLAILYSDRDPRQECAAALIGEGSVTSEITPPGQAPAVVTGTLVAFYSYGGGQSRILAKVTTGEPLPLVYVIPFTIKPSTEPLKPTTLTVPRWRMREIAGKCVSDHPNCFAPNPYSIYGVYSHISSFTMSLHRVERRHGERFSFVSAHCSQPHGRSSFLPGCRWPMKKQSATEKSIAKEPRPSCPGTAGHGDAGREREGREPVGEPPVVAQRTPGTTRSRLHGGLLPCRCCRASSAAGPGVLWSLPIHRQESQTATQPCDWCSALAVCIVSEGRRWGDSYSAGHGLTVRHA